MDNTPRNDCAGALTANVWETPRKQGSGPCGSATLPACGCDIECQITLIIVRYPLTQ